MAGVSESTKKLIMKKHSESAKLKNYFNKVVFITTFFCKFVLW